jgi:cell division transport system ATP-binding protein
VIQLEGVQKSYPGGILALRDVSFTVGRGEFVFLTGPSGAGKSTLLSLLTLQAKPTRGRVILDGTELGRLGAGQVPLLRRRMGVVYQDFRLLYDRTVFENVAFALRVLALPEDEIKRETLAALKRCGLKDKAALYPHKLSGGEQQRVAVARALVHDPGLILADEPTGNLDADTGWDVVRLLLSAQERGATVVVATHNQAILGALSKRRLSLRAGMLESDVTPEASAFSAGLDEELPPPSVPGLRERFKGMRPDVEASE